MAYRKWAKSDYGKCPLTWDLRQARNRVARVIEQGCPEHVIAAARESAARLEAEVAEWEAAR